MSGRANPRVAPRIGRGIVARIWRCDAGSPGWRALKESRPRVLSRAGVAS